MKNSKYTLLSLVLFAVFILCAASYLLFIYKKDILKIYVVYYKPAPLIKTEIFEPIQGGRKIAETPSRQGVFTQEQIDWLTKNMIGDDTGDNISHLNRYFAEITALYWIYKNTSTPYVGMCHYRRFLDLNENTRYPMIEFPSMRFRHLGIKHLERFSLSFLRDLELEKKFIMPWFETHDVILSEPIKLNPYEHYKQEHIISDLDRALNIIKQKYPNMYKFAVDELHSDNGFYPANLFIMRREILDNYASWLFSILLPLYEDIKDEVAQRDTEQRLAFAYLAERLFTVYMRFGQKYYGWRIKEVPHALASNFFTTPPNIPYINLFTPEWNDTFLDQGNNRICSFNNAYRNCGKYSIEQDSIFKVKWDEGDTSYFRRQKDSDFVLEK